MWERRHLVPIISLSVLIVISLIAIPSASAAETPVNKVYSLNWCGYVATDTASGLKPFTEVSASWTVLPVTSTRTPAYSATWVGIGGFPVPANMIQAGTGQFDTTTGLQYFAWFEIIPAPYFFMSNVSPGDTVKVTISKVYDRLTLWRIAMTITQPTGATRTLNKDVYFASTDATTCTAEFVVERPYNLFNILVPPRLANFGTITFNQCTANHVGLNKLTSTSLTMTSFGLSPPVGRTLAAPSTLSCDSFKVKYVASR
ncbi:MAG TPA: G1 family glutamic endopeptidase [Candidatus Acidoferrales bacterium]|nr:G1 family glutamic endopeptidase [Candidatus Acidoferrales bacterium]